jgi:hypothetical protein
MPESSLDDALGKCPSPQSGTQIVRCNSEIFISLEDKNLYMKNIPIIFLVIAINIIPLVGCSRQAQSTIKVDTFTPEAIKTPIPASTIIKTATFLPTLTSIPVELLVTPFSAQTFTPVPKDIFDNFQGLSANCRTAHGLESLMLAGYDIDGEVHITSMSNVRISFDRDKYFSGDTIKISAGTEDAPGSTNLMTGIVVKVIIEDPVSAKRYSFYLYDDGTHKDKKAGDGIYTNTFDETLNAGIYKLYFNLSGRNTGTNEKFSQECFLAKTVNPILIPISDFQENDGKSCRKLETASPIVVRPEGVGGSNSSEFGLWARDPKAISVGDHIIAIWQVGFDGQKPKPNVYMRILDGDLTPVEEVRPLFERNITGKATLIRQGNNVVFSYCGRFNTENRSTSAFLDSHGNVLSEVVRAPSNVVCGSGPSSVWTGTNLLFYSWSIVFGQFGKFLDVADEDGNSISWREIPPSSGSPVVGHDGSMLMRTISQDHSLTIHRLDLEGNDLGEWTTLKAITYEVDGKMIVGGFGSVYMVPTIDGWMVVASLTGPGIYIAHLTPDGSLISDPAIVERDLNFENEFNDQIPYNGGVAILGHSSPFGYSTKTGMAALFISENGKVIQHWYSKEDELPWDGSLFEHQGRLFSIYTSKPADEKPLTNQVLIRELECIP